MQNFGNRLRKLREENGLTQIDVANIIGVGYTTYRKYEADSILPRADIVEKIAKLYNYSADVLIGIGTNMIYLYEKNDIADLRRAIELESPAEVKAIRIENVLQRIDDKSKYVFSAPNISDTEMDLYAHKRIKTVQVIHEDLQLINYAWDLVSKLKLCKYEKSWRLLSRQELTSIKNTSIQSDNIYKNAYDYATSFSKVFAYYLKIKHTYPTYVIKDNNDSLHYFCKKYGMYIDVRGMTGDYAQFIEGLEGQYGDKSIIEDYQIALEEDENIKEGLAFAKYVYDQNPTLYRFNK